MRTHIGRWLHADVALVGDARLAAQALIEEVPGRPKDAMPFHSQAVRSELASFSLADDFTPTVPVIAHAIRACAELGWHARLACCIYPAVPLLQPQTLADALALLEAGDAPYAFPVLAYRAPIQRALKRDLNGRSAPLHPEYMQTRTQDLPAAFHDAGQFYWGRAEAWLAGTPLHADACTLVCDEGSVVDIDTEADWALAEALYQVRRAADAVDAADEVGA